MKRLGLLLLFFVFISNVVWAEVVGISDESLGSNSPFWIYRDPLVSHGL